MNQVLAINWLVFGWSLAGTLIFGFVYAYAVRWLDLKKVEGQTAYLVVAGVTVVLLFASSTVGILNILSVFVYFAAAGFPMVLEYVQRVHLQRRKDIEAAQVIVKEALNDDNEATTGQE